MSAVVRSRAGQLRRSQATRGRILEAATRLFLRDGYLATTMAAIAAEAGVAVQSLYLRFGSKLAILSDALDVAVVGDEQPVPLLERPWVQQLVAAADGPTAVRLFVAQTRRICERTYPLYAVLRAAAASEAGDLLAENHRQRYAGVHAVAELLSQKRGFASALGMDKAADLLYALATEDNYGLLVAERGWTADDWEAWCGDAVTGMLFPMRKPGSRPAPVRAATASGL